jgi:hypothetical protein
MDLCKAIAYLHDLDDELEEKSAVRDLRANSAVREDMLYQLDHARKLVAALERHASNISCINYHNGEDVLIDLHKARTWCQLVEAKNNARLRRRECGGRELDEYARSCQPGTPTDRSAGRHPTPRNSVTFAVPASLPAWLLIDTGPKSERKRGCRGLSPDAQRADKMPTLGLLVPSTPASHSSLAPFGGKGLGRQQAMPVEEDRELVATGSLVHS